MNIHQITMLKFLILCLIVMSLSVNSLWNSNLNKNSFQPKTIIADNVKHEIINKKNSKWHQIKEFEADFRRLILMKGVKYQYKRDLIWRTWRERKDAHGNRKTISYRCENVVSLNCTNCIGGYWLLENNPPCPIEIFSILDDGHLCIFNYMKFENRNNRCPAILKFRDLTGLCDNPIDTEWRITKSYVTDIKSVICEEFFCQIITSYVIRPNEIIFRIINSSNDVIYSRVMKSGGKNYACVKNCGHRDPITKIVTKK